MTVLDPSSTYLKACIDLGNFTINIVEAVHGAASRLKVHNVEFLVQKGEKVDLPKFKPQLETLEHFGLHVIKSIFTILVQMEKLAHLVVCLLIWIEIHLGFLL